MAETDATVRTLMAAVFKRDVDTSGDVSRDAIPEWDSLKHVELLFAVEDSLEITFDADEMGGFKSLSEIVESAERHGADR